MQKQKKSMCRICGKEFTPDSFHPGQNVCFDDSCRHKASAERVARYAQKQKSTARGRKKYAVKEQRRYRDKRQQVFLPELKSHHCTPKSNPDLLSGICKMNFVNFNMLFTDFCRS